MSVPVLYLFPDGKESRNPSGDRVTAARNAAGVENSELGGSNRKGLRSRIEVPCQGCPL